MSNPAGLTFRQSIAAKRVAKGVLGCAAESAPIRTELVMDDLTFTYNRHPLPLENLGSCFHDADEYQPYRYIKIWLDRPCSDPNG